LDDTALASLIKIKMRYVSQISEARAESEVLSINSRSLSAADCLDDPEANALGSQASVEMCNQEECSICTLLAVLKTTTNGCLKCTAGGHSPGNVVKCDTCRTQTTALFAALNTACVGKCEDSIIGSYLCTAATSGMSGQASCSMLDAVAYMVSYMPLGMYNAQYGASGYYGYYGSTLSSMAYKTGVSLGYGASAFNYDDSCYSGYGRRLSHDGYGSGSSGSGSCYGRRLSGMASRRLSDTGNRRLAEVYKATGWGNFKKYTDGIGSSDPIGWGNEAGKKILETLQTAVQGGATDTASVLSRFLGELLDNFGSPCPQGADCTWIKNVRSMVATHARSILHAWDGIGVPVSVTCDPDFEESAVRDALKLVTMNDGCPVPIAQAGSLQAKFLNAAWKSAFAKSIWSG
jgi:hypothetical protein